MLNSKKTIRAALVIVLSCWTPLTAGLLDIGKKNIKKELRWVAGAGYGMPYKGYDKYENNAFFTAKLDILKRNNFKREKMAYRISGDYFMLMVPKDTYGITEDLFDISGGMLYGLIEDRPNLRLYPFISMGVGLYMEWIRVDFPGYDGDSMSMFFGGNLGLGTEYKISERFTLIPEVGAHGIFISGFNIHTHLVFSLSLALNPPKPEYKSYRRIDDNQNYNK